ncbi:arsenate reductase [Thiomicrorhabdus sp.]|uniref:arsenate reductase n=1 Tax=Thiomicrorhabdus sp. TaxID=2039724 RepID=UPI0029C92BA4|nr:arsenate reductase [Thiomicrorhabdus sp.]
MIKMYGIPNCDTVRKARKYLDERQIPYEFHDFKKQGLSQTCIQHWLEHQPLGRLVNKRSTSWKQLTEQQKTALNDGSDLSVLSEMPTLIKRPVLDTGTKIFVGFDQQTYDQL